MKTKTQQIIKTLVLALILSIGVRYALADWTPAPAAPPNNNVDAPVNVSSFLQKKLGALWVNTSSTDPNVVGFVTFGKSLFNGGLTIADGTQHDGYVLTSDASGNASWQTPDASVATVGATAYFSWKRDNTGAAFYDRLNIASVDQPANTAFVNVRFSTPQLSTNYAVVCNGAYYGTGTYSNTGNDYQGLDSMWFSAYNKTTTGFSVHGYTVSSSDRTNAAIGTLDCVVYGGADPAATYSNVITTWTNGSRTLVAPNSFSTTGNSLTITKTNSTGYGGAHSNPLTLHVGSTYRLTYTMNNVGTGQRGSDSTPVIIYSTGSTGTYSLETATASWMDSGNWGYPNMYLTDGTAGTHYVDFVPNRSTGYLNIGCDNLSCGSTLSNVTLVRQN
jgi:hypothetical protein